MILFLKIPNKISGDVTALYFFLSESFVSFITLISSMTFRAIAKLAGARFAGARKPATGG